MFISSNKFPINFPPHILYRTSKWQAEGSSSRMKCSFWSDWDSAELSFSQLVTPETDSPRLVARQRKTWGDFLQSWGQSWKSVLGATALNSPGAGKPLPSCRNERRRWGLIPFWLSREAFLVLVVIFWPGWKDNLVFLVFLFWQG